MSKLTKIFLGIIFLVVMFLFATKTLFFRIDLTEEKRYTISQSSKNLLKNLDEPLLINIYIGEADANIAKLKTSVNEILDEFAVYSSKTLTYKHINPSKANSDKERYKNYDDLDKRGLTTMTWFMRDRQGKESKQVIVPWAEVTYKDRTIPVCIMQNEAIYNEDDKFNLVNSAIEELEFQFIDAIRILTKKEFKHIAFLEGNGELEEIDVAYAMEALSRYYQIDRGNLSDDASEIIDYDAIVIAKPTEPFSESDKFILDQYIMNGGKVLWLLDVVQYSEAELSKSGMSPVVPLDLNLTDMLFRYGIRVEPSVVLDRHCIEMPINIARAGESAHFEKFPFPHQPLLIKNEHTITKFLAEVKSEYPSYLSQVSQENGINIKPLLTTTNRSRIERAPTTIDLRIPLQNYNSEEYFMMQYVPVAAIMEGEFESIFTRRQTPQDLQNVPPRKDKSPKNKMIVVADGDIIRNEIERSGMPLPLGLDRVTWRIYGNSDFIVNSLLYLTEDKDWVEKWIELRNRTIHPRLLNKVAITSYRGFYQFINIAIPLALMLIFGGVFLAVRKHRAKSNDRKLIT